MAPRGSFEDALTPKVEALLISSATKGGCPQQLGSEVLPWRIRSRQGQGMSAQETPSAGHGYKSAGHRLLCREDLESATRSSVSAGGPTSPGKTRSGARNSRSHISASGLRGTPVEPNLVQIYRAYFQYLLQRFLSMRFEPGLIDQTPVSSRHPDRNRDRRAK